MSDHAVTASTRAGGAALSPARGAGVSAGVLRVVISDVRPRTSDRCSAAKALVGHPLRISATVIADGHDGLFARARWRPAGAPSADAAPADAAPVDGAPADVARPGDDGEGNGCVEVAMLSTGNDRFTADLVPAAVGAFEIVIDGWVDAHGTWRRHLGAKLSAGQDVAAELEEGARLIERDAVRLPPEVATAAADAVAALRDPTRAVADRARPALAPGLGAALSGLADRRGTTTSGPWPVWVDRPRAGVGAWYELFPRSSGGLAGAAQRLGYVAGLGFDVVYLPPVHPIGRTARKGAGNALSASADEPGSPWAIGSPDGGHDAVARELGTLDDFDALVAEAGRHGIEIALDYALQCSPDHPWVHEHPEWFCHRPDGSIRFAENPPKQYQDIYPLDFLPDREPDRVALWQACLAVLEHWIAHGVRIFRVDNPHTKPFALWAWLIDQVRRHHPDVVFLAEAFTRPAVMHRLAEIGFSQSYTYFTWRTTKAELTAYGVELAHGAASDYFRPNVWPTTPDIIAGPLRGGPPAAFMQRAVLAATLGPSWGVYSGYELCENEPASDGNEEHARSEKYEIKHRDWDSPVSIGPYLRRLNEIRRRHVALADLSSLRFHPTTNDALLAYSKQVPLDGTGAVDTVLVVVSLDPWGAPDGTVDLDLGALGLPWDEPLDAYDELTHQVFPWWGPTSYVRLDPRTPAHVIHLRAASEVPFSAAVRP